MSQHEYDAAIAEFIRTRGITRCPMVCVVPPQGSVRLVDRLALRQRAEHLEAVRLERDRDASLRVIGQWACNAIIKASAIYFGLVFAVGWVLGPIRQFWVVPHLGRVPGLLLSCL
jgi:hypothetical protein